MTYGQAMGLESVDKLFNRRAPEGALDYRGLPNESDNYV